MRPRFGGNSCPSEDGGRRECRMLAAPVALRAKKAAPLCTQATTGQPTQPASPAQWFTAYTRSPRCAGLSGHRPLKLLSSRVDPSIGGSGQRDFAVRIQRARLPRQMRPSHPAANVRDDREAPLVDGAGWRGDDHRFTKNGSAIFLRKGLDISPGNFR
jgi:hypothetical protein